MFKKAKTNAAVQNPFLHDDHYEDTMLHGTCGPLQPLFITFTCLTFFQHNVYLRQISSRDRGSRVDLHVLRGSKEFQLQTKISTRHKPLQSRLVVIGAV